tara:strand:- start:31145 stop:36016 length:4872 start_codon:yes stop_codon:yes gene_type:complete
MKRIIVLMLISFGLFSKIHGQYENNVWYFGSTLTGPIPAWRYSSFGLDFSGGGAPVRTWNESALAYYESVSVASDENGNVLFYSDGIEIMDASHNLMSGAPAALQGSQQGTTASAVQGAYILKVPNSDTKYLLFTTGAEDGSGTGLRFSEIDLSLQGNAGGGDPPLGRVTSFDNLLEASSGEMLTSYGVCGSDSIWIIAHQESSYNFTRVLVTKDGIQSTVSDNVVMRNGAVGSGISDISNASSLRGSMDINPDGTKLIFTAQSPAGTFILDFNKHTGALSNPKKVLDPTGNTYWGYGSEFSPDGSKVYLASNLFSGIFQYDVENETSTWVSSSNIHGEIISGPDEKLYIGKPTVPGSMTLARIDNPNNPAGSVGYNYSALSFAAAPGAQTVSYAMPQGFVCNVSNECLINAVGAFCNDDSPVQLTANPAGGTFGPASASYITSGGMFDPTLASTSAPNLVTYDNGCDEPDSIYITVNECCPNIDPDLGDDVTICGNTTRNLDVGAGYTSIRWYENGVLQSSSNDSQTFEADSGTYRVEVENADGCPGSDEIEISTHAVPNPTITGDDFYCAGSDVTVDAGAGFTSYDWSPSGGDQREATFNSEGTFTVTVEDANGCVGTDDITISERSLPSPEITGADIVCDGASTDLTVTSGGGTLNWTDTGNDDNPRTVITGGTYTITETDAFGCVGQDDHEVTLENAPEVDLGNDTTICSGQTNLEIGPVRLPGHTYSWSTLDTNNIVLVNSPGTISITVTSPNGCEATDEIIISGHTLPTVEIVPLSGDTFYCVGSDVTLRTDIAFNTYDWSSGGDERDETVSSANTYSVTVTDANGCTATDDIVITENELPTVDLGGDQNVCGNDSITIDATHPDAVSYAWTPNGESTPTIRVSSENVTYGVTVTDNDGCEFITQKTITTGALPSVDLGDPNVTICKDQETIVLGVDRNPGETFEWNTLDTNNQIIVGTAGTYVLTVTGENGCEASDTVVVDTFSLPTVTITSTTGDLFFCEESDVTLDAGAGFVEYDWSSGGTAQTEVVNTEGNIEVTVTDGNGCTATDNVDINQNDLPRVDLGGDVTVCADDSLTLDATHPDASSYAWTPNGESTPTIRVSSDDATYGVTITDVDGCEFVTSRSVTKENPPTVDLGGDDIICDNVTKTLDAGSGLDLTYLWYLDGVLLADDEQTLDADSGIYRVVVRTANGCEVSDTAYIDNHQLPEVTLNSSYEFCAGDSVEVDAGPNGTDYSWDNGETSQTFYVKTAGSITVEITDGNNCTNEATATITENELPAVNLAATDSACEGREIELDVTLSNGVDYQWSDGTSGPTNTQIGPGSISVVITDDKGCVDSAEMVVNALDSLDMSALADNHQVCFGMEDETPFDAGAFEEAVYDWTLPDGGSDQGQVIVPYLDGLYELLVTDKFNCSGVHEFTNAVIRVPFIDLGPDTVMCSLGQERLDIRMVIADMNVIGDLTWADSKGGSDNNNINDTIFTADYAPITIYGTLTDSATGCYTGDTVFIDEYCLPTNITERICELGNPNNPPGMTCGLDIPEGKDRQDYIDNILWSEYEVYNRWGLKVFQSKDLVPSWDGYFENQRVTPGVYYFVHRYEDSSREVHYINGFFQLFFYGG